MRVIDISSHQTGIDLSVIPADGVVIKATEGRGWKSPPFLNQVEDARNAGMKVGMYHFVSTDNTPAQEASNFIDSVKPVYEEGDALVLDWEQTSSWSSDTPYWCAEWIYRVADEFQVMPDIYLNLSTSQKDWGWTLPERVELWLAQYPLNRTPVGGWDITDPEKAMSEHGRPAIEHSETPAWKVVMWQYTSTGRLTGYDGNLDLNVGSLWR